MRKLLLLLLLLAICANVYSSPSEKVKFSSLSKVEVKKIESALHFAATLYQNALNKSIEDSKTIAQKAGTPFDLNISLSKTLNGKHNDLFSKNSPEELPHIEFVYKHSTETPAIIYSTIGSLGKIINAIEGTSNYHSPLSSLVDVYKNEWGIYVEASDTYHGEQSCDNLQLILENSQDPVIQSECH